MRKLRMSNFTPVDNDIKRLFFGDGGGLDYGDFAVYVYIAMHIQVSEDAGKGADNGKQGYCYKTKTAMTAELSMSRMKLDRAISNLVTAGLIECREVPNKYGGRALLEYRLSDIWRGRNEVDV